MNTEQNPANSDLISPHPAPHKAQGLLFPKFYFQYSNYSYDLILPSLLGIYKIPYIPSISTLPSNRARETDLISQRILLQYSTKHTHPSDPRSPALPYPFLPVFFKPHSLFNHHSPPRILPQSSRPPSPKAKTQNHIIIHDLKISNRNLPPQSPSPTLTKPSPKPHQQPTPPNHPSPRYSQQHAHPCPTSILLISQQARVFSISSHFILFLSPSVPCCRPRISVTVDYCYWSTRLIFLPRFFQGGGGSWRGIFVCVQ